MTMSRICFFREMFSWCLQKKRLIMVCSPTGTPYAVPAADPEHLDLPPRFFGS
jgi:hypothetical protein